MKKALMITDIAIWVYGAGHIARVKGVISFITQHCFLTVSDYLPNIERALLLILKQYDIMQS